MDGPEPRPVHPSACGSVIAVPKVGDLQHHYEQQAVEKEGEIWPLQPHHSNNSWPPWKRK
jgi:hypothetical protein